MSTGMVVVSSFVRATSNRRTLCRVQIAPKIGQKMNATQQNTEVQSYCKWNDEHVRDLVKALPSFTSLKILDLRINEIGDAGAEALGDFLKAHFVLPHLWIDRTGKLFCDLLAVLLRVARHFLSDP